MTRTIKVKTPHGTVKFHYAISTPADNDAPAIDKNLPTVLFLHPVYIAMKIFQPQFADPQIRRFNLVSTDLLSHGITEGKVPAVYGQKESAADVAAFMDALKLPPCVVFGLSMGTIIGIQLAISYPAKVAGLFLVSPLGTEEPPEVAEGRVQIHDTWKEGFRGKTIDQEAIGDSVFGALSFSLKEIIVPQAINNWGPKKFDDFETITVKFFTERKGYTKDQLATLKNIPVTLIHCLADIAYSREYLEVFAKLFQIVNPILHRFVLDTWKGPEIPPATTSPVVSPFEAHLRKAGWTGHESDDE